jgi:mannose-1-phosphate guanylyltransferase
MRDHRATMLVLPADHVIENGTAFRETMQTAARGRRGNRALVTIGIKPNLGLSGFRLHRTGRVSLAARRSAPNDIYRVLRFREKPNTDLADTFMRKEIFAGTPGCLSGPSRLS